MSLLNLINSSLYKTYNIEIARAVGGINAAVFLSELVNRYEYHKTENKLLRFSSVEGEWFYFTVEKCEEKTAITEQEQKTAIKKLLKLNLFEKKTLGVPGRRHFKLNIPAIEELILNAGNSKKVCRTVESTELDQLNQPNWNGGINRTIKENNVREQSKRSKNNVKQASQKTLFPSQKRSSNPDFTKSLTAPQRKAHDKLMAYKPPDGEAFESDTVCALMLKLGYTAEKLCIALKTLEQDTAEAKARGDAIKSPMGALKSILRNGRQPKHEDYEKNKLYAEQLAEKHPFFGVTKDYVKFESGMMNGELMFNLPHMSFVNSLEDRVERIYEFQERGS